MSDYKRLVREELWAAVEVHRGSDIIGLRLTNNPASMTPAQALELAGALIAAYGDRINNDYDFPVNAIRDTIDNRLAWAARHRVDQPPPADLEGQL